MPEEHDSYSEDVFTPPALCFEKIEGDESSFVLSCIHGRGRETPRGDRATTSPPAE